jgi:hypothetical protein
VALATGNKDEQKAHNEEQAPPEDPRFAAIRLLLLILLHALPLNLCLDIRLYQKTGMPDFHDIPVFQESLMDLPVIDQEPVHGPEITDKNAIVGVSDFSVRQRDLRISQPDFTGCRPADNHGLPGERNLLTSPIPAEYD